VDSGQRFARGSRKAHAELQGDQMIKPQNRMEIYQRIRHNARAAESFNVSVLSWSAGRIVLRSQPVRPDRLHGSSTASQMD